MFNNVLMNKLFRYEELQHTYHSFRTGYTYLAFHWLVFIVSNSNKQEFQLLILN